MQSTQQNQVGFLSKIDPIGRTLIFSTYLDGMGTAASIALDASGNIYIADGVFVAEIDPQIPHATFSFLH